MMWSVGSLTVAYSYNNRCSLLVSARRFQQLVLTTPATNRFAPVGWINFFWQYSLDDFSIGSRPGVAESVMFFSLKPMRESSFKVTPLHEFITFSATLLACRNFTSNQTQCQPPLASGNRPVSKRGTIKQEADQNDHKNLKNSSRVESA